jgi:serine/threonine protein kinase
MLRLWTRRVPPRTLRPELPPAFEALILSLLAKDPADRPRSAEQVSTALNEALRGLSQREVPSIADAPALVVRVPEPIELRAAASAPCARDRETLDLPRTDPRS